MGRPQQVSNSEILDTMRQRVLAHGPSVSLEVVAKALEVSVPALLKRFGNRRALMLAALQPPQNPVWIENLKKGPDQRPLRTQLLDLLTQMSAFLEEAVPCLTALRESGIPNEEIFPKGKPPLDGVHALNHWLNAARKKKMILASELDAAAFAILGAMQTRAFFSHMLNLKFSERDRRSYIEELADFFTRALIPAPNTRRTKR